MIPVRFNVPASSSLSHPTATGADSPVISERSTSDLPRWTRTSTGTLSPGSMRSTMPGSIASSATYPAFPSPPTTVALFAPSRSRPATALRARSRIRQSK